jgi:hypothetical protein
MIETGIIHNPHYFQFMKENGGGAVPRNVFDVQCGGLPFINDIFQFIKKQGYDRDIISFLRTEYELLAHHREVTLRLLPIPNEQINHTQLMIKFVLHDYTEKQCKQMLFVKEQKRSRGIEERQIMDSFLIIGEEYFRKLLQYLISIEQFISEIHELHEYSKKELDLLNKRYNHKGLVTITL